MPEPPTQIDLKRLAAEVSMQHGIRIDPDDPMMAVVTLNRLVFEQAVAQVLDRVQSAVRDFEAATEKVQVRAGGVLAQEVRDCAVMLRDEIAKPRQRPLGGQECASAGALRPPPVANSAWLVAGLATGVDAARLRRVAGHPAAIVRWIFGDNEFMRMLLFWFAVLGPKARLVFLAACGVLLYAVCR